MSELNQLIENITANEAITRKLFEIEIEALACQTSQELLQRLMSSIQEKFNLHKIRLLLVEPAPISYLMSVNLNTSWHQEHTQSVSINELSHFHLYNKPYLNNDLSQVRCLPENIFHQAKSFALLPLTLENKLFGSLVFTDTNPERFSPELGAFLLEQLAVKVSLCLANVFIREQLDYMANHDRLTGLANRRLMEVAVDEELIRQKRYHVPFSILFLDCNKFKNINDTYGHDCGDKVLTYIATQLKELIRENDKCFRYAGDEFVVVLANQGLLEAGLAAKRLSQFFQHSAFPYEGQSISVSLSCGVAASDGSLDRDALLKKADQHLYQQKRADLAIKD
jgi:diguanylate cyclase (GGDEF)-like protein